MNPQPDLARIRELVEQCVGLSPSGRAKQIETIENPEERRLVEEYLAAADALPRATADYEARPDGVPPGSFGAYRVIRELGRGGYGVVYLTHDDTLNRPVAIKVPRPEAIRLAGGVASYLKEAQALAKLDHPNIVRVYSALTHGDNSCFIVSQYIEGRSLACRFEEGRLGHAEAAKLVATIADALQHAHEQGIVHRDVKPANILLNNAGKPYLADFGLALNEDEVGRGSHRLGTPAYMSPEQARGESHLVSGRTDIYSLGVVLFEALTGKRPFNAQTCEELLDLIANVDPPSPRQKDGSVPGELERICVKALARQAQDRYGSAQALAEDLNAWLSTGRVREPEPKQEVRADARRSDPSLPVSAPGRPTIGGFELRKRIGSGGMGVVYRAWQPSERREVALKCLQLGDATGRQRFRDEIHSLGQVDHPNVVRIYTSGEDGHQLYYAMELIDGANFKALYRRLKRNEPKELDDNTWRAVLSEASDDSRSREQPVAGPLPPADHPSESAEDLDYLEFAPTGICQSESYIRRVVTVVQQIATAAQALHNRGIVHRDIKPENIMLARDGRAVLLDLGIAKLTRGESGGMTRTREFVGSLRYSSPEQVFASRDVDHRSDIYSLGVALWELLTLHPIYGIERNFPDPKAMMKIEFEEPEPVRKYNGMVPIDLQAIVQKCLEKNLARRYQSAAELADELGRFLNGQSVMARPIGRIRRTARQVLRRPLVPAVCAALILAMIFGAIGLWPSTPPVRVGLKKWVGYTPLIVAHELKLCHPVELEFVPIDGEVDVAREALVGKKIDVAMWTMDVQVNVQAHRSDTKVFLKLDQSLKADGFIAREEIDGKRIESLANLKGKKVVWQRTEASDFLARALCKQEGFDAMELKPDHASAEEAAKLFADGKVDAAGTYEPHLSEALDAIRAKGIRARLLRSAADINGPFIVDVAAVRANYLKTDLDKVRAFTRGWFEAVRILNTPGDRNYRRAIEIACKFNGQPGGVDWRESTPCTEEYYRLIAAEDKLRYSDSEDNRKFFQVTNGSSEYRILFTRFAELIQPARPVKAEDGDGSQEVIFR